ncbi:MAG TPA: hypothetical protein VFO77_02900, partial [Actinoplanes sp.]|nr:hypothetical protein [Actinoplanes sp.]
SHTFSVRATDGSGNTDASPATRTFTVAVPDTTPPDTTITSGPANGSTVTTANVTFGFTATEAGSTFQCKLDGAAYGSCASPKAYTGLANGSHTFSVRATDGSGNTDASPATRTFTVAVPDTTPPDTTITKHPKKKTFLRKAKFAFTSSEPGSTFKCKVDRKPWKTCTSPYKVKVKPGKHKFRVRAIDAAGNVDPTPAVWKWRVKRRS